MSAQEVKDEIDAQSGRFEFLKQALTLGLAGLAGIAAIFTDTAKIPTDPVTIVSVCAIGVALLALVGYSLMGLSVYANLLKAAAASTAPPPADVVKYRGSIISHAQVVFVSIAATALALVIYAGIQVADHNDHDFTSIEVIDISRKAIAATGCAAKLDTFARTGGEFRVAFHSDACRRGFIVTVKAKDGTLTIQTTQ